MQFRDCGFYRALAEVKAAIALLKLTVGAIQKLFFTQTGTEQNLER
jgi:hypothetical protein